MNTAERNRPGGSSGSNVAVAAIGSDEVPAHAVEPTIVATPQWRAPMQGNSYHGA